MSIQLLVMVLALDTHVAVCSAALSHYRIIDTDFARLTSQTIRNVQSRAVICQLQTQAQRRVVNQHTNQWRLNIKKKLGHHSLWKKSTRKCKSAPHWGLHIKGSCSFWVTEYRSRRTHRMVWSQHSRWNFGLQRARIRNSGRWCWWQRSYWSGSMSVKV